MPGKLPGLRECRGKKGTPGKNGFRAEVIMRYANTWAGILSEGIGIITPDNCSKNKFV
jgi:hypothetical protein